MVNNLNLTVDMILIILNFLYVLCFNSGEYKTNQHPIFKNLPFNLTSMISLILIGYEASRDIATLSGGRQVSPPLAIHSGPKTHNS